MKKLILITVMLSSFVFLLGCFTTTYLTNTGHEWTEAELHAYWDGFNDVAVLNTDLVNKHYTYANEIDDVLLLDKAPRPEETMTRGWGNCTAMARYYMDFLRYKKSQNIKIVSKVKHYYLRGDVLKGQYHHILIMTATDETLLMQSNFEVTYADKESTCLDFWYAKGFHYQELRETLEF